MANYSPTIPYIVDATYHHDSLVPLSNKVSGYYVLLETINGCVDFHVRRDFIKFGRRPAADNNAYCEDDLKESLRTILQWEAERSAKFGSVQPPSDLDVARQFQDESSVYLPGPGMIGSFWFLIILIAVGVFGVYLTFQLPQFKVYMAENAHDIILSHVCTLPSGTPTEDAKAVMTDTSAVTGYEMVGHCVVGYTFTDSSLERIVSPMGIIVPKGNIEKDSAVCKELADDPQKEVCQDIDQYTGGGTLIFDMAFWQAAKMKPLDSSQ